MLSFESWAEGMHDDIRQGYQIRAGIPWDQSMWCRLHTLLHGLSAEALRRSWVRVKGGA